MSKNVLRDSLGNNHLLLQQKFPAAIGLAHLRRNLQAEGILKRTSDHNLSTPQLIRHSELASENRLGWYHSRNFCPSRFDVDNVLAMSQIQCTESFRSVISPSVI